jgi:MFS family permease
MAGIGTAPTSAPILRTVWTAIFILTLMMFGGALMRGAFGPLQEAARLELGLSDFQISLIQGIGTGAPVALFSIPIAWGIDHGNRRLLLIALLAICAAGTLWTALADGFSTLFMARVLSSLGATCCVAVVISLAADLSKADGRGRALISLALGAWSGAAAAFALGGGLYSYFLQHPLGMFGTMSAWRESHMVLGIVGALLSLCPFFISEPARHEVELANAPLRVALRVMWGKRAFLAPLFLGQIGVTIADTAATIWAAPVLIRNYNLEPGQFAAWMGGLILVTGIVGSVFGGLTADWGQRSGRRGGLLVGAVVATAIGIPAAIYPVMPTVTGFGVMFGMLILAGVTTGIVSSTAVAVLIPNEERGITIAVFGVINSFVGLSLAPTVVTLASSAMGGEQHLASALAGTGVITGILALVGYFFAARNAPTPLATAPQITG